MKFAPATVGDCIAALAFLLSLYAVIATSRFNKRQRKLIDGQERLNEVVFARETVEATKAKEADLGASFVKLGSNSYRLKVWNRGKATARRVRLEFPEGNECVMESDVEAKFPLELLEPHHSVELIAVVGLNTKRKHPMRLCWDDNSGDDHQKMVYPTL